jgi:parallel beta-helix repeat protein
MSSSSLADANAPFLLEDLSGQSSRGAAGGPPSTPSTSVSAFEDSSSAPLASSRNQPVPLASTPAYIAHSPLNITGDADFLLQNTSEPFCWAGTGIENDPYIIEGLNITLGPGATTPAISLANTTFYFILRASWLAGAHQFHAGVYLENVTHGTMANNTIQNHFSGIRLAANCTNNTITRNTIFNCTNYGLIIEADSENNSVTWNTFLHNNQGGPQAWDGCKWNHYDYNHWNDQASPDADTDGVVDDHYLIGENPVLSFDGSNDIVSVADDASLDLDNMTIELWVKTPSAPSSYVRLVGKGHAGELDPGDRNYGVWIFPDPEPWGRTEGAILFQIDSSAGYQEVSGTVVIADGTWHHIAATYNGSMMALYIDGVLDENLATTETPYTNNAPLLLGRHPDYPYYNGLMDEVRILNQSLTAAEIQEDFATQPHYPTRNGTVAWYHLNEATGTTVTDSSGNGNHGTISGATWRRSGSTNPALVFDGVDDTVSIPDDASLDLENMTIEFWMKTSVMLADWTRAQDSWRHSFSN